MTLHRPRPCGAHACIFLSRHNVSNPLYLLRPMSNERAAVCSPWGWFRETIMLDSRSTKANIRNLAILTRPFPTFLRKISPPRNLLFHNGRTMSADFICGIRYTRGKLCILHDHTLTASLSCSYSFYLPRNNAPVLVWIRVWIFVYRSDLCKVVVPIRCLPKVMVNIGIRFRSTVCYLIRSKLISKISGDEKCKNKYYYIFLYGYYSIYNSIYSW